MKGFGPYRVVGVLGRGGMGAVFEVEHRELGVRYALKTILAARASEGFARELERFKREAELSARLDHPGILTVHSASFEGQIPYLVVDLLSGGSLGERVDRGDLISPEEAVQYGLALARALSHAHERGVLHRDLKPDNVMLDETGAPRLVDFGLALESGRETRLTQSGVALGTPATMAPEQVLGERTESEATDVYGLGATLYWLLAGEPPLGSECADMMQLVIMIIEQEPRALSEVRTDLPRPLVELVTESLRKDPELRPSLADWIRVLSALGQGVELDLAGRRRGRKLAVLIAGGLLAAAGGAGFLAQLGSSPEPSPEAATPEATSSEDEGDWRSALGDRQGPRALKLFLRDSTPLREEDLGAYARLLESAELSAPDLSNLEARLAGLEDRAGAWGLACLAAGEVERARQHARRGSEVRSLIDLELERAAVDREKVVVRLARSAMAAKDRDTDQVYASLLSSLRAWPRERVARLDPAGAALAGRVLDRLQWTLARAFLVRNLEKRFLGKGEDASEGRRVLAAAPEGSGVGRLLFEIALNGAPEFQGRKESRRLLLRAHEFESELLADPAGRVFYASYALHYGDDPLEALRLGGLACNNLGEREVRPVDSYMNRFLPEMVARAVEVEWLGRDLAPAERGLRSVEAYLRELEGVERRRPRRTHVARLTWFLSRGQLAEAAEVLREVETETSDFSYLAKIALLRAELQLAQDPLGAARDVLDRLSRSEALFVEHYGLVAHARAILGLSAEEALREVEARRGAGLGRLGLAWHAFDVGAVIDGQAWWPGRGSAPPSRVKVR